MSGLNPLIAILCNPGSRPTRVADLYATLTNKTSALLVPTFPGLTTSGTSTLVIDDDFLSSHIIRLAPSVAPPASLSRSSSRSSSPVPISVLKRKTGEYVTANSKIVEFQDGFIKTGIGFKKKETVRVLRDGIYYDDYGKSFLMLFIDAPLVNGVLKPSDDSFQISFRRIIDTQPAISQVINARLDLAIHNFNEKAVMCDVYEKLLGDMKELLQRAYTILDSADKAQIQTILDSFHLNPQDFYRLFESYIMERTYDITFFKVTQFLRSKDISLSEASVSCKNIDISQVGLPRMKGQSKRLLKALEIFRTLGGHCTPQEKLECLLQTIAALGSALSTLGDDKSGLSGRSREQSLDEPVYMSTDYLVPLLLLTVLRSEVPNLVATLAYMRDFSFANDVATGEYGYALLTLEAVIEYIMAERQTLAAVSAKNEEYWAAVKGRSVDDVRKIWDSVRIERDSYFEVKDDKIESDVNGFTNEKTARLFEKKPDDEELVVDEKIEAKVLIDEQEKVNDSLAVSLIWTPPRTPLFSLSPGTSSFAQTIFLTRDANGNTPLMMACASGKEGLDIVKYLFEKQQGSGPRDINYRKETPLMIAASQGDIALIQLLLEDVYTQDTIDAQDIDGNAALHLACMSEREEAAEVVRILVKGGASVLLRNTHGDTPVLVAAIKSNQAILRTMIELVSTEVLDLQNEAGECLLHLAKNQWTLDLLRTRGVNPNPVNIKGQTPFLQLVEDGKRPEVIQYFIKWDAIDHMAKDLVGKTALHLACANTSSELFDSSVLAVECVRILLKSLKELINIRTDNDGSTALHVAAREGGVAIVRLLLEAGANPNIINFDGLKPVEITTEEEVRDLLDDYSLFRLPVSDTTNRLCAVTRAEILWNPEKATKTLLYVIKSGIPPKFDSISTVKRTFKDFQFLWQQVLFECPESFVPSLDGYLTPPFAELTSKSFPTISSAVFAINVRRLDRFLAYLLDHPILQMHELLWEFMLVGDLQRDLIMERSRSKAEAILDNIVDNYSNIIEDASHEEIYYRHATEAIEELHKCVRDTQIAARRIQRSTLECSSELHHLTQRMDRYSDFQFSNKAVCVRMLDQIAAELGPKNLGAAEALAESLEDLGYVINGTLLALRHPQEVLQELAAMERLIEQHLASIRREEAWGGIVRILEDARKIRDAEAAISQIRAKIARTSAQLNFKHKAIADEMAYFQSRHSNEIKAAMLFYVRSQKEAEKARLVGIEEVIARSKRATSK